MKRLLLVLTVATALAVPAASHASLSIILHGANQGITSLNYTVSGSTIDIFETWGAAGNGYLEFRGLDLGVQYTVNKYVTNTSGADWTRFANELLDPAGQDNDDLDPQPYPGHVPAGYTTSNDWDYLTFRPGTITPTSDVFGQTLIDVNTDVRDFIDFYDGTVASGSAQARMTFGLYDGGSNNQPFLLSQRPNSYSNPIPEPATLLLLGTGLIGGFAARRRRR